MKIEEYLKLALNADHHDKIAMTQLASHLLIPQLYNCNVMDVVYLSAINKAATSALIYNWSTSRFDSHSHLCSLLEQLREQTNTADCKNCKKQNLTLKPYKFCPDCGSENKSSTEV